MLAFGFSRSARAMLIPDVHFRRPPTISSPRPRGFEPGLSSLADEFPFEFSKRAEHMEN
jgi:hypothetical protein